MIAGPVSSNSERVAWPLRSAWKHDVGYFSPSRHRYPQVPTTVSTLPDSLSVPPRIRRQITECPGRAQPRCSSRRLHSGKPHEASQPPPPARGSRRTSPRGSTMRGCPCAHPENPYSKGGADWSARPSRAGPRNGASGYASSITAHNSLPRTRGQNRPHRCGLDDLIPDAQPGQQRRGDSPQTARIASSPIAAQLWP